MDNQPKASQVALVVKNPPANAGDKRDVNSIPGLGRSPGGGHGNPLQFSCLKNPDEQQSLVSYSPWSRKELDTTEQLSTAQHIATAESSKFVDILSAALSQHHLLGFEIAQLEFHHLH